MFDDAQEDDEDEADQAVNIFSRSDDYGGGLEDQRTNQDEMDRLLQPVLDFDDNDEEGDSVENLLNPKLLNGSNNMNQKESNNNSDKDNGG